MISSMASIELKFCFWLGLHPCRPHWGRLQRSPDLVAGFKGPTSKGRLGNYTIEITLLSVVKLPLMQSQFEMEKSQRRNMSAKNLEPSQQLFN